MNGKMSFPTIPGMLSTHRHYFGKSHFRKSQVMEQEGKGIMRYQYANTATNPDVMSKLNETRSVQRSAEEVSLKSDNQASNNQTNTTSAKYRKDPSQPPWIANDRLVLRFYGYFNEKLHERGQDIVHPRRVILYFHLSNQAISIYEPIQKNAGFMQGEFLKKSVIINEKTGRVFSPEDFSIGKSILIHGHLFYMVDCDAATRSYYKEAMNIQLSDPQRYPDEKPSSIDEIMMIKQKLQARAKERELSKAEQQRKLHENYQKVLRFYVTWRDPHPMYPDIRRYILHYFLCDDTIEIVEPREERQNTGRGNFPVLLSRRKVLNENAISKLNVSRDSSHQMINGGINFAGNTENVVYLTDKNLRCGEFITIHGRQLYLTSCDPFTQEYYLVTHGITQEFQEESKSSPQALPTKWKMFQPQTSSDNGPNFLSNNVIHRLMPTKTQESYKNDIDDSKQLRFKARFYGLNVEDVNSHRVFILTFYLADDTLSVFEPPIPNSGVIGGRYLDRGRFQRCKISEAKGTPTREKQKTQSAYNACDFYVGAIIQFDHSPKQRLELFEADRQTLQYCEAHPDQFEFSSINAIVSQIAKSMLNKSPLGKSLDIRQEFRELDPQHHRLLEVEKAKKIIQQINNGGCLLNLQQIITIVRKFGNFGNVYNLMDQANTSSVWFKYDNFCDAISSELHKIIEQKTEGEYHGREQNASKSQTLFSKLRHIRNLRSLLSDGSNQTDKVPTNIILQIMEFHKIMYSSNELYEFSAYCDQEGIINFHRLCDKIFVLPIDEYSNHQAIDSNQQEIRSKFSSKKYGETEIACDNSSKSIDFENQAWENSPKSLLKLGDINIQDSPKITMDLSPAAQMKVAKMLQRVFGFRKYQLRKALRAEDENKVGILGEEGFMAAILSVEPQLSDNDTYLIAEICFPTNSSMIDYNELLESVFSSYK